MSDSGVQLDPVPNTAGDGEDADSAEKPFLFKMTLDPIKNMQTLLSDDDSNLTTAPASILLSKYACLRGASRALLVHSVDLEKKLAVANAEIDRLRACLQAPQPSSFSIQPSLLSMQATPEIFAIQSKKTVRPRSSDRHQRPSLRTQLNAQPDHDLKHVIQHRPYTMLEEIRENVSSRSASINSASSRRASISGPSGSRVPSARGRSSSTSSHTLNSTVAGIPSIASVTKGPYPAHASVITNLYRQQNRRPSVKSSTIGSKRRSGAHNSCSPRRLSFISSPASSISGKRRLRKTKNENSLENIIWAINGDNRLMKREIATLQEKFENVTAALESFTRVSMDQRDQNQSQGLAQSPPTTAPCPIPISINQLTDFSVSTPIDTANELHSGETVSIDCSTINPILSALHKQPNRSYSSTVITSGQHSLIVPPRYATNKDDKDKSLTNELGRSVDVLMECPMDLQAPRIDHEVGDAADLGRSIQPSYLQQIYHASQQQTLEQQNNELREKNKKLKSMLSELKKSFHQGNISAIIEDNDILVAKVSELERKLFIHEATAARASLAVDTSTPKTAIECSTQTDIYIGSAEKGCTAIVTTCDQKAVQLDPQSSTMHYAITGTIEIQTILTARDIDLSMNKLLVTEGNLAKTEAELIQEREHSFAVRAQLVETRNNALDYLQEANRCKEELTKVNDEVEALTKENLRINRELLSMESALEALQTAPIPTSTSPSAPFPAISLGTQTDKAILESDVVTKDDPAQDILAENISLMERLRLLNEELHDVSSAKEKAAKEITELQKKYDTLHAYAYSQHATYARLSEEQLSTISMQQKILLLEEKQRESETSLQRADEVQQAHTALTQELWRITAENERLSRANTKLTDELKDFKRRTSEALKEHIKNTVDLEKHHLLEEEAASLRASLEKLKDSSNKQFRALYAEKKELEATIAQLRANKTEGENILMHNAMNLEKRVQSLESDNKASVEEGTAMRQRAEVAEAQLQETIRSLQIASEEGRRLQKLCSELQNRDAKQNSIIVGQQQEIQSIQLALHDEVLGLQVRIKELEEDRERLSTAVQSLSTEKANKQSQTQSTPHTVNDTLESEKQSFTFRNAASSRAVNDAHVKLVLENAHLRQELSKSEQQIRALREQYSDFNGEHIARELAHLQRIIENINIPPQYKESPALYVAHLEKTCEDLNEDLRRLQQSYKDIEKRHALACTQIEQMLGHPELRVIVRDINGAFLNSAEQHREINDAYEAVIEQLFQTIRDLSSRDPRVVSGLSIQDYLTATSTASVLQANLRAKELEIHKLNRTISDLRKANTEILMLAPTND